MPFVLIGPHGDMGFIPEDPLKSCGRAPGRGHKAALGLRCRGLPGPEQESN